MAQMTDDDLRVRQLSHYQFQLALPVRAARPEPGRCSLCSTRGLGEVLTIAADDADNLQDVLKNTKTVFYDIGRRVLMGVTKAGD